jgi:hypothetical protein
MGCNMTKIIKFNKNTLEKSIAGYINELEIDGVGLWQIVNEALFRFKLKAPYYSKLCYSRWCNG